MINRVVLVGRLTKDVEVRKTTSNLSVAQFTVACDKRTSRNQENNGQPTADFINCVAWRQTADFLGQYARKGAMVGVDGRIQTRSYDNAQGQRVYVTEVVADDVRLLESRSQSEARAQNSGGFQQPYSQSGSYGNSYGQPQQSYSQPQQSYGNMNSGFDTNDDFGSDSSLDISSDDLPF